MTEILTFISFLGAVIVLVSLNHQAWKQAKKIKELEEKIKEPVKAYVVSSEIETKQKLTAKNNIKG